MLCSVVNQHLLAALRVVRRVISGDASARHLDARMHVDVATRCAGNAGALGRGERERRAEL